MEEIGVWVVGEMAKKLKVTPQWVLNRIYRGTIKATQQGSTWLIPNDEVDRFLKLKEHVPVKRGKPWRMHYVYAHLTPENLVFYVGMGTDQRIHNFGPQWRSKEYNQIVKSFNGEVRPILIQHNLTEEEARRLEKQAIALFLKGRHPLVNKRCLNG